MNSNPNKPFPKTRTDRFLAALTGLYSFFKSEENALFHLVAALLAVAASIYFQIDRNEWLWVLFAITLVFVTELINTAIEYLCDMITSEWNPHIKMIKDISAAAVLLATIGSVLIGLVVFVPYMM